MVTFILGGIYTMFVLFVGWAIGKGSNKREEDI